MREEFRNILNEHGIHGEDIEAILYAVSDMLNFVADKIKVEEPYAVTTIRDIERTAYEVFSLTDYL